MSHNKTGLTAFIPLGKDGQILNIDAYTAFTGFNQLGIPTKFYKAGVVSLGIPKTLDKGDIVVGSVRAVHSALRILGVKIPEPLDYVKEFYPMYGRRIWRSTIEELAADLSVLPVFVKPHFTKQFESRIISKEEDLLKIGVPFDTKIWCSEEVDFEAEWRCFVIGQQIVDVRRYAGHYRFPFRYNDARVIPVYFKDAPAAYTVDIGYRYYSSDVKYDIVEFNDGYSIGSYGVDPTVYALLLMTRWCEMVGIGRPLIEAEGVTCAVQK